MAGPSFLDLLRRVRDGDEEAAAQLYQTYGDQIRRIVRMRLANSNLRRMLDSQDICQSVMANFFVRASAGEFDLDTPEQLFSLLLTMARNKLVNKHDFYRAARRDINRNIQSDAVVGTSLAGGETPSVLVGREEILERLRSLMSDEERRILDQRAAGCSWAEVAEGTGESPEALRKRVSRAIDRIADQLGIRNDND